jgi:hypothetical protein
VQRIRSGDEPMHARSPLGLRLAMAGIGLGAALGGVVLFVLLGSALAWVCAALAVVSAADIVVVAYRIHQGPHYQPGRTVPPYRPLDPPPRADPPRRPASMHKRHVRYMVIMGTCLLLIVNAWVWVRWYSVGWAVGMSMVAALMPPIAAISTNAESPILRGEDRERDEDDEDEDAASARWPDYPPQTWSRGPRPERQREDDDPPAE